MENRHLITNAFLAFYTELARIKSMLQSQNPELLLPEKLRAKAQSGAEKQQFDYNQLAAYLSRRLEAWLLHQRKKVEAAGTALELKTYMQGEYVMVALADELFILELDWPGAEFWPGYLLEYKLYSTDSAGSQFFRRLDALLREKSQDSLARDLATVFLLAIRMGFAGPYRGRSRYQELEKYQRTLLSFIGSNSIELPLFRQSYAHTVNEPVSLRLAPLAPWIKGAALMLCIYVLVAFSVWSTSIDELVELTSEAGNVSGNAQRPASPGTE